MNILFVCKYNNFRSKFAEAIFNSESTSPKHSAQSAGVNIDEEPSGKVLQNIETVAAQLGYSLTTKRSIYDHDSMAWADIIVNVASDVSLQSAPGKIMLSWNIDDVSSNTGPEARLQTVKIIQKNVTALIKKLRKC